MYQPSKILDCSVNPVMMINTIKQYMWHHFMFLFPAPELRAKRDLSSYSVNWNGTREIGLMLKFADFEMWFQLAICVAMCDEIWDRWLICS